MDDNERARRWAVVQAHPRYVPAIPMLCGGRVPEATSPTIFWRAYAVVLRRLDPTVDEAVAAVVAYRAAVRCWGASTVEAVPADWRADPQVAAMLTGLQEDA